MPRYWGGKILILGSFPEVGQKQKTEKGKVDNNNGQGGAHKAAWANEMN